MAISDSARLRRSHLSGAANKKCCHCGRLTFAEELTLDHILPRSRGGRLTKKNTALACAPCNGERGSQDFWMFRQWKRAQVLGLSQIDLSHEKPTRAEWENAHKGVVHKPRVKKGSLTKYPGVIKHVPRDVYDCSGEWKEAREIDPEWWITHKEPGPKDSS